MNKTQEESGRKLWLVPDVLSEKSGRVEEVVHTAGGLSIVFADRRHSGGLQAEFEELASRAPVVSGSSFLGKEHFRLYGRKAELIPELSGRLHHQLTWPIYAYAKGSTILMEVLYKEHGIVVMNREEAGLDPLPGHLNRFSSKSPGTSAVGEYAMQAQSFIELAENTELLSLIRGLGEVSLKGVSAIAGYVKKDIEDAHKAEFIRSAIR